MSQVSEVRGKLAAEKAALEQLRGRMVVQKETAAEVRVDISSSLLGFAFGCVLRLVGSVCRPALRNEMLIPAVLRCLPLSLASRQPCVCFG